MSYVASYTRNKLQLKRHVSLQYDYQTSSKLTGKGITPIENENPTWSYYNQQRLNYTQLC